MRGRAREEGARRLGSGWGSTLAPPWHHPGIYMYPLPLGSRGLRGRWPDTDARRDACAPCHHASVGQIRAVDPCVIVCEPQSMPDRRGRAGATCVLASVGGRSPDAAPQCDDLCLVTFQTKSEIFLRASAWEVLTYLILYFCTEKFRACPPSNSRPKRGQTRATRIRARPAGSGHTFEAWTACCLSLTR